MSMLYNCSMRYIQLQIRTDKASAEALEAVLIEGGFESMQIDDSSVARDILDNPELYKYDYLSDEIADFADHATDEVTITLYFTDDEEGRSGLAKAQALTGGYESAVSVTGDDSEWLYKWQEHFRPTKIGGRIVVKPSWEDYEASDGELVIEMDPGMAFGSGLHETTSLCIRALEEYMKEGERVLDVGTGTGILAMAAVLLGASDALGIDIDDEAVRVASENISLNGMSGSIRIIKGDLTEGVSYDADVIVANLMADLVMRLSPAAASQLKPGGLYITSGILDIKEEIVCDSIRDAGFEIIEVLSDGEWRAVVARKS